MLTVAGELPQAPRSRRRRVAALMVATGVVHALGLALLCRAAASLSPLPEQRDLLGVLIYDPPPAAAVALPRGSKAPRVVEETRTKEHIDPIQAAEPDEREEIELEKDVRTEEPFGSETGSERGSRLGMDGGVENGMPGGLRGGMPGGVPDGTGTSPVFDYDAPPRLLRQAGRDTVSGWLFQPALKRGHPVPAIAHAPVRFRIY